MIAKTGAFSSFSVNDLNQARSFYSQTLGLQTAETPEGLELEIADGTKVFVYPKPNHVPATFTVLNFKVKSIEDTVDELKQRGVRFERYNDAEIKTDAQGIFRDGGMAIAWFKDPAGNILSALQSNK
jgi:catechol 2,3-dioxygenase-like lactoylglutathione lyase family enzyme